jgi:8-oxo-dGTP pyrophosphatase MutT (NUDIX family)
MSPKRVPKQHGRGRQFAALPFTEREGETMVMLVTSRETRRWVLPKGWAEKDLTGPELAAKEAFEEAGLVGAVAPEPIGSYSYLKRLPKGRMLPCEVDVFAMRVDRLLDDWPERGQRTREWFTLPQAALAVEEGDLVTMLLRLAAPGV